MNEDLAKILYIDDEQANLTNFKFLFSDDFEIITLLSPIEALEMVKKQDFQIVISDQRMPEMDGIPFLAEVEKICPETIRILLTAFTETKDIIDAINIGHVYQYITKPFDERLIRSVLDKATEIWQLKKENQELLVRLEERNEEFEQANEELRQINEELIRAKEKAEENDRLKTAFLQNMSHEIRTPMNAIVGFSDFLMDADITPEKRKSFASIIINSSKQLLSIVTDILTISSLETNQEKLSIDSINLNSLIVDLLSIFKPQALKQNLSFYSQQQLSDIDSEIFTDRTKIVQILTNLITNALKFTHEGHVNFGYELCRTMPSRKNGKTDDYLKFFVKDTGIGIDKSVHNEIFERFRQAETTINKRYGGTGLGLSISKGFVELLEGDIWVESEKGKGSTFYFTIPYKPVNAVSFETISKQISNHEPIVLVAEDEEYNYLYLEEILLQNKIKVLHAINGIEALEFCKVNKNIVLVLMDIKMPELDGYSAAKQIKEFRNELPIIAQSAYALEHEKEKFKGTAFDGYVTKPINRELLKEYVQKYLNKKE